MKRLLSIILAFSGAESQAKTVTVLFVFPNIRKFCSFLPYVPLELIYKKGCCTFFLVQQPHVFLIEGDAIVATAVKQESLS